MKPSLSLLPHLQSGQRHLDYELPQALQLQLRPAAVAAVQQASQRQRERGAIAVPSTAQQEAAARCTGRLHQVPRSQTPFRPHPICLYRKDC